MRVMVIVKATADSEAGLMPSSELLEAMGKFNEELANAGIMLSGDGLKPSSNGKRVAFDGPGRIVMDGPFAETKELIAGFWLISAKDKQEALSWVRRIPFGEGETIELMRVFEAADFGDALPPEVLAKEAELRARSAQS